MRTFPHFNPAGGHVCPICGTAEDKETVLIPLADKNIPPLWAKVSSMLPGRPQTIEAIQVHTDCIESHWFYYETQNFIGIACRAKTQAQTLPPHLE